MKTTQIQKAVNILLFSLSLIPLLQSIAAFSAQMDVETQTDPMPPGPPPERYQEWSDLQELFDNAVVDKVWSAQEFRYAVGIGTAYRKNCIDTDGVLHLIEVEEIELAHVAALLSHHDKVHPDKVLTGFRFKNVTLDHGLIKNSRLRIKFHLCNFSSFIENHFAKCKRILEIKFQRCDFSSGTFESTHDVFIVDGFFEARFNFDGCNLSNSSFRITDFFECNFNGCNLSNSLFKGSRFLGKGSNFNGCNISNSLFTGSNFGRASFNDCNLFNCSFNHNLFHGRFNGCNFSNNSFNESLFWPTDFNYCKLSNSSFNRNLFVGDFNGCNLSNSSFVQNRFSTPNFDRCNLSNSSFEESKFLEHSIFASCDLSNSSFKNTKFEQGLNLSNCLFSETNFEGVTIASIEIDGNTPHNSSFSGAHIVSTPVLRNCCIKLEGARYFASDFDPFPSAFLLTYQAELQDCKDQDRHPIPKCNIRRAPDLKTIRPRNKQNQNAITTA